MSLFPDDDTLRKALPVFQMIARYFPKALREVTRVCVANNVRYSPEREPHDIQWARDKSPDQLGSAFRHMLEHEVDGKVFEESAQGRVYVLAEAAWRVLAALELEIEAQEAPVVSSNAVQRQRVSNDFGYREYQARSHASRSRQDAESTDNTGGYPKGSGEGAAGSQASEFRANGEAPF